MTKFVVYGIFVTYTIKGLDSKDVIFEASFQFWELIGVFQYPLKLTMNFYKKVFITDLSDNCMFKVNNRNTRTRCEIYSNLTIKTPELRL